MRIVKLVGGLVAGVALAAAPTATAQATTVPRPVSQAEVKWILPPAGSVAYGPSKGGAEAMGYETAGNDDMTYPAPRR